MRIKEQIINQITEMLQPEFLEIVDQSDKHKGHSGWREGGETHFHIKVISKKFQNLSRIQRHQLVYKSLSPEPMNTIHALSMDLSSNSQGH